MGFTPEELDQMEAEYRAGAPPMLAREPVKRYTPEELDELERQHAEATKMGAGEAAAAHAMNGATGGFLSRLAASASTYGGNPMNPVSAGDKAIERERAGDPTGTKTYEAEKNEVHGYLKQASKDQPLASGLAEGFGAVVSPFSKLSGGGAGAVERAARAGVVQGAVSGAANSEGKNLREVAGDAVLGAGVGGLGGAALAGGGQLVAAGAGKAKDVLEHIADQKLLSSVLGGAGQKVRSSVLGSEGQLREQTVAFLKESPELVAVAEKDPKAALESVRETLKATAGAKLSPEDASRREVLQRLELGLKERTKKAETAVAPSFQRIIREAKPSAYLGIAGSMHSPSAAAAGLAAPILAKGAQLALRRYAGALAARAGNAEELAKAALEAGVPADMIRGAQALYQGASSGN